MKPWILLETAAVPGGGELSLWRHVRDFAIRMGRDGRNELMSSRAHGSEEALASRAYARLGQREHMAVLVGGLGMGFTTAAALRALPADGTITVAELVPAVVAWNRGLLAPLAGHPLADPRVCVYEGDVAALLRAHDGAYDVILLDVDNGPHALTAEANHWLYGQAGLQRAYRALRPGGVLAVWSATPHEPFTKRLAQVGFSTEVVRVPAHGTRGARHVIWLAVKKPPEKTSVTTPADNRSAR